MDDLTAGLLFNIGLPAFLILVWWAIGRHVEKAHLLSLEQRESEFAEMFVSASRHPDFPAPAARTPLLVMGDVVIASDFFKSWVFSLRNIFGGESKNFTRLYDRAIREATLRMLAQARAAGYNAACNVRFGSSDIGGNAASSGGKKTRPMASCYVTGTAYVRR